MYQLYSCDVTDLCNDRRGEQRSITYIDQTRLNMQFTFPLSEIATDFYDELKGRSSGYASFDYEDAGFRPADLGELFVHLLTLGYPCLSVA
jgi:translation elongation factor EF-4